MRAKKSKPEPEKAPQMTEEELIALAETLPEADARAAGLPVAAIAATSFDNVDGFAAFYWLIHGNTLPEHARGWIEKIYKAHEEGVAAEIWAFRGGWKSTTVSGTFTAYRIGKEPDKSNLVIMSNDDSAEKIGSLVAEIIEYNPNWKIVFPNVVPDKDRGWGAEAYWIKDNTFTKEQWSESKAAQIDPTLVTGGINSSRVIGKHPTGVLIMDDIHDEKNSSSPRLRQDIVTKISGTIMPTGVREKGESGRLTTWMIAVGTPWDTEDAYHYMKGTGEFMFSSTPVMVAADAGEDGAVYIDGRNREGIQFTDIVGWWRLSFPDYMGVKAIISARAVSGKREFWRMYMLDLESAKVGSLKYMLYPNDRIDYSWQMGGGADLATVLVSSSTVNPGRDFFSLAYGAKTPMNNLVIVGGVFEQCTQAQAEEHLKRPQSTFKNWKSTIIEGDGIGEQIYVSVMMRNPGLRLVMMKTGGKGKRHRQELEMGPWLENGLVMISDADTPYLNALRKALDDFPEGNNDIRDGLYWCCRNFPETLQIPKEPDTPDEAKRKARNKKRTPINALARA